MLSCFYRCIIAIFNRFAITDVILIENYNLSFDLREKLFTLQFEWQRQTFAAADSSSSKERTINASAVMPSAGVPTLPPRPSMAKGLRRG